MLQELFVNNLDSMKMVTTSIANDAGQQKQSQLLICTALSGVATNIFFGEGGTGQHIHLDGLQCNGTEMNLLTCTHSGVGINDCGHHEDIGISCKGYQSKIIFMDLINS